MALVASAKNRRWKNPFEDFGVRFWSLEFSDSDKESAFARGVGTRLAGIMQALGLVFCLVELLGSCRWIVHPQEKSPLVLASIATDLLRALVSLVMSIAGRIHLQHGRIRSRHLELFFASGLIVLVVLAHMREAHLMSAFLRNVLRLPDSNISQNSEGCQVYVVLYIDGAVTFSSLLPFRWSSCWPLYMFAMFWYPMVSVAFHGLEDSCSNFVYGDLSGISAFLSVLVSCSILGKRALEAQERRQFNAVIAERTLRAETEFKLSRHADTMQSSTGSRSHAPTLATADVLIAGDGTSDETLMTLERVTAVARREQWLIEPEDVSIDLSRVLGKGGFGVVVEGSAFGLPVAVKMSLARLGQDNSSRFASFISELRILRKLRHPNIVLFQGAIIHPALGELALVLEMVVGSDLRKFIKHLGAAPSDKNAYRLFCGMAQALMYMHSHEPAIVHGDLKPGNVLVELLDSETPRPKITDFGLSRILSDNMRQLGGTLKWMAPEVMGRRRTPEPVVDSYGLGRIALFMFSGAEPFTGWTPHDIRRALKSGNIPGTQLAKGSSVTAQFLWDTAQTSCEYHPEDRPDLKAICDQLRCLIKTREFPAEMNALALEIWRHPVDVGVSERLMPELALSVLPWTTGVPLLREMVAPKSSRNGELSAREPVLQKPLLEEDANPPAPSLQSVDAPKESVLGRPLGARCADLPQKEQEHEAAKADIVVL